MTKELQDFFKIISEGKKSSKKETENESLLSNEKYNYDESMIKKVIKIQKLVSEITKWNLR